jgi:hypothetical protein
MARSAISEGSISQCTAAKLIVDVDWEAACFSW